MRLCKIKNNTKYKLPYAEYIPQNDPVTNKFQITKLRGQSRKKNERKAITNQIDSGKILRLKK